MIYLLCQLTRGFLNTDCVSSLIYIKHVKFVSSLIYIKHVKFVSFLIDIKQVKFVHSFNLKDKMSYQIC